jgi:hypothetical protein
MGERLDLRSNLSPSYLGTLFAMLRREQVNFCEPLFDTTVLT